jgi:hypothetical protein
VLGSVTLLQDRLVRIALPGTAARSDPVPSDAWTAPHVKTLMCQTSCLMMGFASLGGRTRVGPTASSIILTA